MEELDPEVFSNIWLLGDLVAQLEKVEGRASAVQSKCTCTSPFLGVNTEVLSTCSLSCETSVAVWVQTPITAWRKTASAPGLSGNKETFTVFEKIVAWDGVAWDGMGSLLPSSPRKEGTFLLHNSSSIRRVTGSFVFRAALGLGNKTP